VEGTVIFAGVIFLVGLLFSWFAVFGWRHRKEEKISLLEAGILKATGAEPLPLTRFDRWLQNFQLVMMSIFGPSLIFIGVTGFLIEAGVI
jgi:hypothetical protein